MSWTSCNFSFEGATFDCDDLTGARFIGGNVSFHGVSFVSGTFHFNKVEFAGARVSFTGAQFAGYDFRFGRAQFQSGEVTFKDVKCTGEASHSKHVDARVPVHNPMGKSLTRLPKCRTVNSASVGRAKRVSATSS